jgi:hypothetical protein
VSAGTGGGSKRAGGVGRAMWPRIPSTCASARLLVHGRRGEGEGDREGPRRREREREGARGAMARRLAVRARETRKRDARVGQLAPTIRPHWAASEREGKEQGTDCR